MISRLLVVEDSITIRKLVELALKGTSIQLEFATTGADALARVRTFEPHVILMDYVLPDMKGVEICERLATMQEAKADVIVMSAKMDEVKRKFSRFTFARAFVMKPFKAGELAELLKRTLAEHTARTPHTAGTIAPPSMSPKHVQSEREAAAFALFAQLRPQLARIPMWMSDLGDTPPGKFFGQRILTPDIVDKLLDALLPVLRDRFRKAAPGNELRLDSDVLLEGRLGSVSAYDLLSIVRRFERTSELVIGEQGELICFFRAGTPMLVTSKSVADWRRDLSIDLEVVAAEHLERASNEQAQTGKPLLVTLAEAGSLPPCDLATVLSEQGRRLFRAMLPRLGSGTPFVVRSRAALPLYVDAYGRALAVQQVLLERLREDEAAASMLPGAFQDTIFKRRTGFSRRIMQLETNAQERRVLALTDGRSTSMTIAERTGIDLEEVLAIQRRLEAVELIARRDRDGADVEEPVSIVRPRQIMILEPDKEGFVRPLTKMLAQRSTPYAVTPLSGDADLYATIRRAHPQLIVLNVDIQGVAKSAATARLVRSSDELRDLILVGITELPPSIEDGEQLLQAGFDTVLPKPVSYVDIERLLVA